MTKPFWTVARYLPVYALLEPDIVTLLCPLCGGHARKSGSVEVGEGTHGRFFTTMHLTCDNGDCPSTDRYSMTLKTFGGAALVEVEGPQ